MICCEKCFKDVEIKSIIKSLNNIGTCEVCNKEGVYIYNTNLNDNLVESFSELLGIYTPETSLPKEYPREKLSLLKDVLYNKWNIFNIDSEKIYTLVKSICSEKYEELPELFDSPIGILELANENYESQSMLRNYTWEEFAVEIKTRNRFHTRYVDTDILRVLCSYLERPLKKGEILYRARISDENGFSTNDMGAPPPGKGNAGRVNPVGINFLYLANDHETTVHEVRAAVYDYVSIGQFILKEDITIIDFSLIDQISPFTGNALQLAINMDNLREISNEIAKPLRRIDSPLDYLPTQYIVDFIKSIKHNDKNAYQGIKYKSTLNKNGYNIAIFDGELFECVEVFIFDVDEIKYKCSPIDE